MKRLAMLLCALTLVACGKDKSSTAPKSITGTYTLRTVNGATLPFTYYEDSNERDEVTSGEMVLADDNTYAEHYLYKYTYSDGVDTDFDDFTGTYTRSGSTITFTDDADGTTFTGTISGTTLTSVQGPITLVYRK